MVNTLLSAVTRRVSRMLFRFAPKLTDTPRSRECRKIKIKAAIIGESRTTMSSTSINISRIPMATALEIPARSARRDSGDTGFSKANCRRSGEAGTLGDPRRILGISCARDRVCGSRGASAFRQRMHDEVFVQADVGNEHERPLRSLSWQGPTINQASPEPQAHHASEAVVRLSD